jgi:hypothetical protein
VNIAAELIACRHPAHGGHNLSPYDEAADVTSLTFGNEFLYQDILFCAL